MGNCCFTEEGEAGESLLGRGTKRNTDKGKGFVRREESGDDAVLEVWSREPVGLPWLSYVLSTVAGRGISENKDLSEEHFDETGLKYWSVMSYVAAADGLSAPERDLFVRNGIAWSKGALTAQKIERALDDGASWSPSQANHHLEELKKMTVATRGMPVDNVLYAALLHSAVDGLEEEEVKRWREVGQAFGHSEERLDELYALFNEEMEHMVMLAKVIEGSAARKAPQEFEGLSLPDRQLPLWKEQGTGFFTLVYWSTCLGDPDLEVHQQLTDEQRRQTSLMFSKIASYVAAADGLSDAERNLSIENLYTWSYPLLTRKELARAVQEGVEMPGDDVAGQINKLQEEQYTKNWDAATVVLYHALLISAVDGLEKEELDRWQKVGLAMGQSQQDLDDLLEIFKEEQALLAMFRDVIDGTTTNVSG